MTVFSFMYHTVYPFKVQVSGVFFSILTKLFSHHHYLIPELQKETLCLLAATPIVTIPRPPPICFLSSSDYTLKTNSCWPIFL